MARRQQKGKSQAGRLRIVAGIWRSRLLDIADVDGLRPTGERIRETLFNWLAPHIQGARCLDLFAGTGALGLEALSRGASEVVFVEQSPTAEKQLRTNIDLLEARGATVLRQDAFVYLQGGPARRFDIVFLDPPFAAGRVEESCHLLAAMQSLADGAFVYIEDNRSRPEPALPPGWRVVKNKTAGNVRYMLVVTNRSD